jgi:tetratricopeptide (TPR) repeat protein
MREELKSHLLNLQGLEFVSEKQLFPELEYIFKHALTQEVAYDSLLHKRRKEIHERIGKAIEDLYPDRLEEYYELLAYHYGRSDNTEKTLDYLDRANQKAVKLNAVEEGKAYFDEAMKLLDALPETKLNHQRRISLLVNQWAMYFLLFKHAEYYDLLQRYEPMAVDLGNPNLLGLFYARMAQCEWWPGHFDQAIQRGAQAVELCETAGNIEGAGSAYLVMQWSYFYVSNYDKVLELKENILTMTEQQFNLRTIVWAFCAAALAYNELGRWDAAVQEAQKGLTVAEEFSDNSMISFAAFVLSVVCTAKGDHKRAFDYAERAVQKAPTPADKAWTQTGLAIVWCRTGEPHRTVELLSAVVPMFRAVGYTPGVVYAMYSLGEGYWATGAHDKARQTLERCLELAELCGMRFYIGTAHSLLGKMVSAASPSQAESHFKKCIEVHQEIKAQNELAKAYVGYGRLHKQQGNIAQAREYLTTALDIFKHLGNLLELDKVKEELAGFPKG